MRSSHSSSSPRSPAVTASVSARVARSATAAPTGPGAATAGASAMTAASTASRASPDTAGSGAAVASRVSRVPHAAACTSATACSSATRSLPTAAIRPTSPRSIVVARVVAGVAAEALGRPIRRTILTDNQYREALAAPVAAMLLGLFAASRAGEFAAVDPTLGELLGRPPLTVRDVLAKD